MIYYRVTDTVIRWDILSMHVASSHDDKCRWDRCKADIGQEWTTSYLAQPWRKCDSGDTMYDPNVL